LLVFKKYKKIKKNQIYKKERKLRDQFGDPCNILPINTGPQLKQKRGGNFDNIKKKIQKIPNPKPIFFSRAAAPRWRIFFPSHSRSPRVQHHFSSLSFG
jgi:hypothetical protein